MEYSSDKAVRIGVLSIMLCSIFVSGQVSAAWGNDSPWSKKHAEQKRQAALEEAVLDKPVVQPVVEHVAEPIPAVVEPEPIPMAAEPEPIPMAAEAVPMPAAEPAPMAETVATQGNPDILSLPGSHYAVQVYASAGTDSMDRYKVNHGLEDLIVVKTDRNGSPVYVLISVHEDRSSANQAASNLEQIIGSKPWVRSVKGLQSIVMH